jgi:hypothetical protein
MVRYFYAYTPLAIVASIVFLALPWLGVIALMVAAVAVLYALGSLAFGLAAALGKASRSLVHGLQARTKPAPASMQPAVLLANARANRDAR